MTRAVALEGKYNGSIKTFFKKLHSKLKTIGPRIVKGIKKTLDFVTSDPTIGNVIQEVGNRIAPSLGNTINKVVDTTKKITDQVSSPTDLKKILNKDNINMIKDTSKEVYDTYEKVRNKWKDNNKRVQSSSLDSSIKEQVEENTNKLLDADKGSLPSIKGLPYLNLLTMKTGKGMISNPMLRTTILKDILKTIGVNKTPTIAKKGRLFLAGLQPMYMISRYTSNPIRDSNEGRKSASNSKSGINSKFKALFAC